MEAYELVFRKGNIVTKCHKGPQKGTPKSQRTPEGGPGSPLPFLALLLAATSGAKLGCGDMAWNIGMWLSSDSLLWARLWC